MSTAETKVTPPPSESSSPPTKGNLILERRTAIVVNDLMIRLTATGSIVDLKILSNLVAVRQMFDQYLRETEAPQP